MTTRNQDTFRKVVAFAPLLFAAHFAEEIPGFVEWVNSHVAQGMTDEWFWQANIVVLIITTIIAVIVWSNRSTPATLAAVIWLSFMMGANSLVHITASLALRQYVPGVATASLLYVPFFPLVLVYARRRGVSWIALLAAAVVGALPMFIQGYLIIFEGTRLF
jgi:hypothetical protein